MMAAEYLCVFIRILELFLHGDDGFEYMKIKFNGDGDGCSMQEG